MGVIAVVLAFVAFIYFGFKLALCYRSRLSFLVSSEIIFMLGIQAVMNMGVVLDYYPQRIESTFLSFGGSSPFPTCSLGIFMSSQSKFST